MAGMGELTPPGRGRDAHRVQSYRDDKLRNLHDETRTAPTSSAHKHGVGRGEPAGRPRREIAYAATLCEGEHGCGWWVSRYLGLQRTGEKCRAYMG